MKKQLDYSLLVSILALSLIGLLMVYSASNVVASYKFDDAFYFFKRQLLFFGVGLIMMFGASKVNISKVLKHSTMIFFITLALLVLVLVPGIGMVRGGARSWIGLGNFSLQPAEFMKIALIIVVSKYISSYYYDLKKFKNFIFYLGLVGIIFALIMLQPDFGTGLVLIISSVLMLFLSGAPLKYFGFLAAIGACLIVGLVISAPYRLERIFAFIDPWSDPLGSGFQGIQSLFAIAPSGIFGLGYNNSIQKHFFLPEPQNDFIFAIVLEELGLIGGGIIIGLYLFIFIKSVKISAKTPIPELAFLSLGIGVSLFVQVTINIFVVIGLLPITGITLPLISYGGSSLMITLAAMGLLLNISRYQER